MLTFLIAGLTLPARRGRAQREQNVFMRLSVFRGGFTRPMAESVVSSSAAVLASLLDKSFLRHNADGRYTLHEVLRQYGAAKLAADAEAHQATHDKHSEVLAQSLQLDAYALRVVVCAALIAIHEGQPALEIDWLAFIEHHPSADTDFTHEVGKVLEPLRHTWPSAPTVAPADLGNVLAEVTHYLACGY